VLSRLRAEGIDENSISVDPGFADPANGDFTLSSDSPAVALGFQPIDMSRIGLNGTFPEQWKGFRSAAEDERIAYGRGRDGEETGYEWW